METGKRFGIRYRRWMIFVLVLISTFNFMDRVVFLTLGQAMKQDLGLSDLELGVLSGLSFAIFYSLLGLPIARLAERHSRVKIIAVGVAVWSLMTFLCGTAASFMHMLLLRVGGGAGEAAVQPPAISLIADHYPPVKRAAPLTLISMGMPLGMLVGAIGGGWMAQTLNWRTAFFIVGAPGVLLAAIVFLTLREPARGAFDGPLAAAGDRPPPMSSVLRLLASKRSFWHFAIALSLTTFATNGIGSFMFPHFVRTFRLGFGEAGFLFGIVGGLSSGLGMAFGAFAVAWASARNERWYGLIPAIGVLLAVPFYISSFLSHSQWIATGLLTVAGLCMFMFFGPTLTVFQNMVGSRMRASAAFLFYFISNMIGMGLGPTAVGFASDSLAARAFTMGSYHELCHGKSGAALGSAVIDACTGASASGLKYALVGCACVYAWAALHYVIASRSVAFDLRRAETTSHNTAAAMQFPA